MEMTPNEILRDFNSAKNKRTQIQILADLNLCDPEEIATILIAGGADKRTIPKEYKPEPPPVRSPGTAQKSDAVNHPSHYNSGKIEVIDFIEDQGLGFSLGNVVKYVARAGKKDPAKTVEDLRKAAFYLDHEIKRLSEEAC